MFEGKFLEATTRLYAAEGRQLVQEREVESVAKGVNAIMVTCVDLCRCTFTSLLQTQIQTTSHFSLTSDVIIACRQQNP